MDEINAKLAFTLLIVVLLSTLVSTFAFFNLQHEQVSFEGMSSDGSGRVSIEIQGKATGPEPISQNADVQITIKE
jgi:hypothetical protein